MDMNLEDLTLEELELDESNKISKLLNLDDSINLSYEVFETLMKTNDIDLCITLLEEYSDRSLYHSALKSMLLMANAGLTYDQESIQKASLAVTQTAELCNRLRKTGLLETVAKMIRTPDYDKYTDIELHAELTYSKFLALSVGLTILENPNIINLIKIVYRLRQCMISYKECRTIFKRRTAWESETSKRHFEAGIRLAHGITHLAISHIPPKLLKIVNFFGYKGVRSKGFEELNKCAFELTGVSSKFAEFILIGFWLYPESHVGLGPENLGLCEKIVNKELVKYPDNLLYRGAIAKLEQLRGNVDSSIKMFNELARNPFIKTHKCFEGELIFSHALKCEWKQCLQYAQSLRLSTSYSPACATYVEAVFRYIQSKDDCDDNAKEEATKLFELVPTLRIRYLGKTITPEKVVLDNAIKYFKNNKFMLLPEMEMMYHSNGLCFIEGKRELLETFMTRVDTQVQYYKKDLELFDHVDNYLLALFYKGVVHKHMHQYIEARECFIAILNEEARIEYSFEIPPQAAMEIGLVALRSDNHLEAKQWLEKALNDYSGYYTEHLIQIRCYAAFRKLGVSTDKRKISQTQLDEYAKAWLKEQGIEDGTNGLKELLKSDQLIVS